MGDVTTGAKRGGVLLRVAGDLVFVPALVAVSVVPFPLITRVPGAPADLLGIALDRDEILPVVAIGDVREAMVVCTYRGESIGLVGGALVASGMFDVDGDEAVVFAGEHARPLDLPGLYAAVHRGGWGGRWGG
jgi:hypothetical protein